MEQINKPVLECMKCGAIIRGDYSKCLCGSTELKVIGTIYPEINDEIIAKARAELNECYEGIINYLKGYIDMKEDNYKFVAMWIIGTYFHKEFNTFPFLFLNAMRGSGKTRLLKLISWFQKNGNGDLQNHISEAVLFRTAQERGLILDEFEHIGSKEKGVLRELLNAGYKRGGVVRRMKKVSQKGEEKQVVEEFNLFTPIAMANISGIDEVLQDRCITLILEKSNNPSMVKKIEHFDEDPTIKNLKVRLTLNSCSLCSVVMQKTYIERWNNYINDKYIYTTTHTTLTTLNYTNYTKTIPKDTIEDIKYLELFNKIDELGIQGRNLELLFPLIIVAGFLDEKHFEDFLLIAKDVVKIKKEEEFAESKDVQVIDFVSKQTNNAFNEISVKGLTMKFREFLGEMEDDDKWLNDKWFGRALKRLALISTKRRTNTGMTVTLDVTKAKEKLKIFRSDEEDTHV